jgi:purine-nucleoside phosphorylase
VKTLIVTNAAGGIRPGFRPASFMLIRDHLNLLGANPLRGPNLDEFGPRFVDMTQAYDPALRALAVDVALGLGMSLPEGVYAILSGPTYETPSEIQMLATLGADAVGMSTVPEVIVARHHGMRVLGFSCITNAAAGISQHSITHEEVIDNTKKAERQFGDLLTGVIGRL